MPLFFLFFSRVCRVSLLPLNSIARLESLVLHSQVRGVEICCCVEGFDG